MCPDAHLDFLIRPPYFRPVYVQGSLACLSALQADTSKGPSVSPGTLVLAACFRLCRQGLLGEEQGWLWPTVLPLGVGPLWEPRRWKLPAGSQDNVKEQDWKCHVMQATGQKGTHSTLPLLLHEDRIPERGSAR